MNVGPFRRRRGAIAVVLRAPIFPARVRPGNPPEGGPGGPDHSGSLSAMTIYSELER